MLDALQLCQHLQYVLHTPVRLYDADGSVLSREMESQEDPLVCDPAFARRLLAMRREDKPILHFEFGTMLYATIPAEKNGTFLLGPVCYDYNAVASSRRVACSHRLKYPDVYRVTYVPIDIVLENILLLFHSASDIRLSRTDLALHCSAAEAYSREAKQESYAIIYRLRENNASHNSYAQEVREQKAIRDGDLDALRQSWRELQEGQVGRLGKDEATHCRNLAITVIALACRSAIEGGILPEVAFSLSDSYTMKLNDMTDVLEIAGLCRSAEMQYAEMVRGLAQKGNQNRHILRCKEMIHDRLHQRIRVGELAAELGVTRNYLSRIFLREEGIQPSAYITREKIRASEHLLLHSEDTLDQIASTFGFASQSHYGQEFKKYNGLTPGAFREKYRSHS